MYECDIWIETDRERERLCVRDGACVWANVYLQSYGHKKTKKEMDIKIESDN